MRELEVVQNTWQHDLADLLNECFAQADTHTTKVRAETIGVSFFAAWGQTNGVGIVEALRDELTWLLPFLGIVAEVAHTDPQLVSFSDVKTTRLNVLRHSNCR